MKQKHKLSGLLLLISTLLYISITYGCRKPSDDLQIQDKPVPVYYDVIVQPSTIPYHVHIELFSADSIGRPKHLVDSIDTLIYNTSTIILKQSEVSYIYSVSTVSINTEDASLIGINIHGKYKDSMGHIQAGSCPTYSLYLDNIFLILFN